MIHPKYWLRLIIKNPKKQFNRQTKYYSSEDPPEKDKDYPSPGQFTDYGNFLAGQHIGD